MRKMPPEELIPEALEKYTHDLTVLAQEGRFAPLQRRELEVERIFQVLARRLKNNPVLIGEDSAALFAIVVEVVRRISIGDAPEIERNWLVVTPDVSTTVPVKMRIQRVVALDLEKLIADTKTRSDFEKLLKSVFAEIKQTEGQTLLFVDPIHRLVGAHAAEKAVDAANILAPALSRGEVCIIGTSNLDDYRRYVERDQALQRRFQEVIVRELSD